MRKGNEGENSAGGREKDGSIGTLGEGFEEFCDRGPFGGANFPKFAKIQKAWGKTIRSP